MSSEIGVIGLSVMGQNLALNIASKGFPCAVFNRTTAKVTSTVERAQLEGNIPIHGFETLNLFVQGLSRPRKMIIMVQAGKAVDEVIDCLIPLLEKGDLIIDGGNEWFRNTEIRLKRVSEHGILYMGMGVSGGEEGARNGPSLMPGGSSEGYALIEKIVTKVAAQAGSGPCVAYMGPRGAGNYVKMVHNGIEYADMQLIAESYDFLRHRVGLNNAELYDVFTKWSQGPLKSFLIEITAIIMKTSDELIPGSQILDAILDRASGKGTGKWTSQEAAERSCPAPAITAALDMRNFSSMVDARVAANLAFGDKVGTKSTLSPEERNKYIQMVEDALYCSKIMAYTQGMSLLKTTSDQEGWNLNLGSIAKCWQGGCIIRAIFLDEIVKAYNENPSLPLLCVAPFFAEQIKHRQANWRQLVAEAISVAAIPVPAFSANIAQFDTLRSASLPMNLVQAQRDFFGAHEYRRHDRDGSFHTRWTESHKATPEAQIGVSKDRTAEAVSTLKQ